MRKHYSRGQTTRERRRQAWRAEIRTLRAAGMTRRLANYAIQAAGGSWRTFGDVYELGGPVLGPPAPKVPRKPGVPYGVRCLVFKDGRCLASSVPTRGRNR